MQMHRRPDKEKEFGEWFSWVISGAEIYDYGRYPVQGTGIWMPYGFQLRRRILDIVRWELDSRGHEEILLPLLIPEDLLRKEAEHIRGFEGEVYWVTHGGETPLGVRLALRPTSETALTFMESLWIKSYRQLPKKYYQVVSIFRYETKATKAMIRLREVTTFKEAHTLHDSFEDAERQVEEAVGIYRAIFNKLGIPYLVSKRPDWDKFAGALYTIAFDTIMPDGRVLQIGTVHNLGQNFTKAFEVRIQLRDGSMDYAWQTSYGISDRVVAAVIAIHGDGWGAVLPPLVAPIQVIVIPIPSGDRSVIEDYARRIADRLSAAGIRVHIDTRDDVTPGAKYYEWELRGVPLRIEIGAREAEQRKVTVARRDLRRRVEISEGELVSRILELFEDVGKTLAEKARRAFEERVKRTESLEEARRILAEKRGIVEVPWCGREECGLEMEAAAEARALGNPLEPPDWVEGKKCPVCGREAVTAMRLAKTY